MTAKPFCDGPFSSLKGTNWIVGKDKHGDICHVLDQRGWGYLTGKGQAAIGLDSDTAAQMQADMQQWIVDALNAAWNRRADLAAVPAQVNEEQNTEQRKRFWNWLPLAYRDGHIGEHAKFTKYNMEVAHYAGWSHALEPQPDPRDEVIARLVEALEMMRSTYPYNPPCYGWQEQVEAHKAAKAALAAAKAVQHG